MLSSTVIIDEHVEVFELLSVTVKVTKFGPTCEQSKPTCDTAYEAIPHASKDPLSISYPITALPDAFNCIVISLQSAVGAMLSSTVTVALHVEIFPLTSVTVKTVGLAPTFAHVNALGKTVMEAIAQLSLEPLSIDALVMLAFPVASN
jgi:hypothetical protein